MLHVITSTVAPRKVQQLLDGLLGTLCLAFGSVMELRQDPKTGISFAPEYETLLRADLDALSATFLGIHLLEEEKVVYSVRILYSLVNDACGGN